MKKRFFAKRFLLYLAVILIPTLLMGAVYYAYVNHSVRQRIAENTAKSLTSVYSNVEHVLGSAAYQQQLLTNSPRLILSLTKSMNQDYISYEDLVIMSCVNSILTSPVNNNLYIKSIYFSIEGCAKFLSTADGLVALDQYDDRAWHESYLLTERDTRVWMEKRVVPGNAFRPDSEVVSIYQRMTNAMGVIVVNITPERFNVILDQVQTEPNQALFIVDREGEILFSNRAGLRLRDEYAAIAGAEPAGDVDMVSVQVGGSGYMLSARGSENYRIRLVSLMPEGDLYQQPNQFLVFFWGMVAASVLVAVVMSYAITRKNFSQIGRLMQVFDRAERGEHPVGEAAERGLFKDEYDLFLNNIVNLYVGASQLRLELAEKQVLQKDAEIAALQMQINPHFLFNTLQTLDMEALREIGRQSSVNHIIRDLSDLLKYSLEDPARPVPLGEEMRFLKLYTDIQQYRYEDKFILYCQYADEDLARPVMRLMLQPLVENSLYHGIKPLQGRGCIKLRVRRQGSRTTFCVIDNGVGMDRQTLAALRARINSADSTNIGLTNLHRRLLLRYGEESGLRIRSKKGWGTAIAFTIGGG